MLENEEPELCPLYQAMLPELAAEIPVDDLTVATREHGVWSYLKTADARGKKGYMVVRSRFLGLLTRGRQLQREWRRAHSRAFTGKRKRALAAG